MAESPRGADDMASTRPRGPSTQENLGVVARRHSTSVKRSTSVVELASTLKRSLSMSSEKKAEESRKLALEAARQELKIFASLHHDEVLKQLNVDATQGLSSLEAAARLRLHGPNELDKDPPTPLWKMFAEQFTDLLVILLIIASIIAGALGEYPAAITIIAIVIGNAVLGVVQESRAGAALDALQELSSPIAKVLRDGAKKDVDSKTLVPGDIIFLETGNKVAADIRIIEAQQMSSIEMALTGESDAVKKFADMDKAKAAHGGESKGDEKAPENGSSSPVVGPTFHVDGPGAIPPIGSEQVTLTIAAPADTASVAVATAPAAGAAAPAGTASPPVAGAAGGKKKEELLTDPTMVYMACEVAEGNGKGVVLKTGMQTKMGEIAHLLKTAEDEESPLEKKLDELGGQLGLVSIAISIVVFIIGISTGRGSDPTSSQPLWLQMLLVAVSLTVAAVPEGLPACVTIALAIGMQHMVRKHALVRNLHSVETLGSSSVICTDKTGTLTAGVMTAKRLYACGQEYGITGEGYDPAGYVVPNGTDETNVEACKAAISTMNPEGPQTLLLLISVLCSNASIQLEEKNGIKRWVAHGNTSERPLVVAGYKTGIQPEPLKAAYPRVQENPFSSVRKMMSTFHQVDQPLHAPILSAAKYLGCCKGAANVVLKQAVHILDVNEHGQMIVRLITEEDRVHITKQIDSFSERAFRVLGVGFQALAERPADLSGEALERDLIFCGLIASMDPERPEVSGAINKCRDAGIRVVMITGDYVKTAKAIAERIHLLPPNSPEDKAVDCEVVRSYGVPLEAIRKEMDSMKKDRDAQIEAAKAVLVAEEKKLKDSKARDPQTQARLKELAAQIKNVKESVKEGNAERKAQLKAERKALEEKLDVITAHADVYARAKPADKITIVRSLQRQGHICAMTGDGVNDAPALKQANIGIAMGITGTDVAKAASDMVLTDDNFVSIVDAIEEGRTMYMNISKFVFYLLTTNVSEVFSILIAVIMGLESPLLPIQILWLNLTTDGAPAIALAVEMTEPGIMNEGPRKPEEPIIEKVMVTGIIIQTIVLTSCVLTTYIVGLYWHSGTWNGKPSIPDEDPFTGLPSNVKPFLDGRLNAAVDRARTMTIVIIVFAELFRAYTSRALRVSIFRVGVFTNPFMQWGVGIAIGATLVVVLVPGVQEIFSCRGLDGQDWGFLLALSVIPVTVDELTKIVYRRLNFGVRPKAINPFADRAGQNAEKVVDVAEHKAAAD